jgi:RNA polymerase sigma-70 factor (ECF subfamily)
VCRSVKLFRKKSLSVVVEHSVEYTKLTENPVTLTFDEVYTAHAERVLNLAFRLTGDEDVARDLCQEVFIKVYQNLETFEHRSQIFTWIYRIAINHINNHLKKERRRRWVPLTDDKISDVARDTTVEPAHRSSAAVPSSEKGFERSQRAQIVWSAIQTLDAKYRMPLVLHHYEGLSYKEITEAMQISMSAVESRIHRAKKQLIKKLEPWLGKI